MKKGSALLILLIALSGCLSPWYAVNAVVVLGSHLPESEETANQRHDRQ